MCDDENKGSGDGCSAECKVETGYDCPISDVSVCSPVNMDGLILGNEECDDNNSIDDDGCSNTSQITDGWECNSESPSKCVKICVDGTESDDSDDWTEPEENDDGIESEDGDDGDEISKENEVEISIV